LDKEENFTNDRLNGLLVGGSAERQQFVGNSLSLWESAFTYKILAHW